MQLRKLLILGASAFMLANITGHAQAAKYLFSQDDEASEPAAKVEKGKKTKVDPKAKAKEAAAEKAKAKKEAAAKKAEEKKAAEAKAKAAAEKQAAADAKKAAKAKAEADRLAAIESRKAAKAKAAKDARDAELAALTSLEVAKTGNNGELRSEPAVKKDPDFFTALFGGTPKVSMLPETRALDAVLETKQAKKFKVKPEFEPQTVEFAGYDRGTIVIDTDAKFLYLIESGSRARRYAIAVGRDGLQYKGTVAVGDKQEWPRWIPTLDMQKREPKKYGQYKDGMAGGPENPLGARAIYLYEGKKDTHLRIHGTNQPQSIGTSASNGCFRMINEHVMDLYGRVKMGTKVVVL